MKEKSKSCQNRACSSSRYYCYPFSSMTSFGVPGLASNDEGEEKGRVVPTTSSGVKLSWVELSQVKQSKKSRIKETILHNPHHLARHVTSHHITSHHIIAQYYIQHNIIPFLPDCMMWQQCSSIQFLFKSAIGVFWTRGGWGWWWCSAVGTISSWGRFYPRP